MHKKLFTLVSVFFFKKKNSQVLPHKSLGMAALTEEEFWQHCQRLGFTGHAKGEAGPPNYTSVDGKNRYGHTGRFHVPAGEDTTFLSLVARAIDGGVALSISQCADPPEEEGKDAVFRFFMDFDMKNMFCPDMTDLALQEVALCLFHLVQPMFPDEVWSRHMMDPQRLPLFLRQRWPNFASIRDVLTAFKSNPNQPPQIAECDASFTLSKLFCTNIQAQNWISTVAAAAIAFQVQQIVYEFYPDTDRKLPIFETCAMASINGGKEPSSKIGVHVHIPRLCVTVTQMLLIVNAVSNSFCKLGGERLRDCVDAQPFTPNQTNIRMPFTWKTERKTTFDATKLSKGTRHMDGDGRDRKQGGLSKRPRGDDQDEWRQSFNGQARLYDRRYMCVALFPPDHGGHVDLSSKLALMLCVQRDILLTMHMAKIRTDKKATSGFICARQETTSANFSEATIRPTLLTHGYGITKVEELYKRIISLSTPVDRQALLEFYVASAQISHQKRVIQKPKALSSHLRSLLPGDPEFIMCATVVPTLLNRLFVSNRHTTTQSSVYNGMTVGNVTVDVKNIKVYVKAAVGQSICCHNRRGVNGRVPSPHNYGNTVCFVFNGDGTLTQKCYHDSRSAQRVSGGPCKAWPGHTVKIYDTLLQNINPKASDYHSQCEKVKIIVNVTLPKMMEALITKFVTPSTDIDEEIRNALETRNAEAEATAVPPLLKRSESFTFGNGSGDNLRVKPIM